MKSIEQMEMDAHRKQIIADVHDLVEKYRAIFDWDIPEINQKSADALIVQEIRRALDQVAADLSV